MSYTANHATQEDVEKRLRQMAHLKRAEIEKGMKSVPSEDGCKVFTSESSSEKSNDVEDHGQSEEDSPSWSSSRWESPLRGSKPGESFQTHSHLQHQKHSVESIEKSQNHPQSSASPFNQNPLQGKVEVLSHNLQRLVVEDRMESQYLNRVSAGAEGADGHGAHQMSSRRPGSGEIQPDRIVEGHHPQVQKSVSFNDSANGPSMGGVQTSIVKDLHSVNRTSLSDSRDTVEDHIHHILDDFLSARYDAKSQYSKVEGYESQRDIHGALDLSEYGTNSCTSSVGDGDSNRAFTVENHSGSKSGELDSYVVLDHGITRPGSYQRSSSASRHGQLVTAYHHSADVSEKHHSDGDTFSSHTQSASKVKLRPTSYQQPSHSPNHPSAQSPPHYAHNKPRVGQIHVSYDSNLTSGAAKSYPFLPRADESPYVLCQHCEQLLSVPFNLPPTTKVYQKLRCGKCFKISLFLLATDDQLPASTVSPRGHVTSPSDSGFSNRHVNHGAKSDSEIGDRCHASVASGASSRLPPVGRNIPRIPSGSKLSAMSSATNTTTMMGHCSVSNLHPATGAVPGRSSSSSHYGDGVSYRRSHSAYGVNGEHVMSSLGPRVASGSDYEGHHPQDGRFFHTSSESDNDSPRQRPPNSFFKGENFHASSRMPLDRHVAQQYSKDEGYMQETNLTSSMSLKGITKKSMRELTKPKQMSSNNLYRRNVIVNGSPIPDVLVKRAEKLAGPIHPGSYWYDSQVGFWGVSGGPCVGIIPVSTCK